MQNGYEYKLQLPTKYDGSIYSIEFLKEDQKDILTIVIKHLKEFLECKVFDKRKNLLRLTVTGVAGSGKSTFINTLVSVIRNIFEFNDSIQVFAPTGSAAFTAGGETIHRGFKLPNSFQNMLIDSSRTEHYVKKIENTVAIILDERSLIDATNLGAMEYYCQQIL